MDRDQSSNIREWKFLESTGKRGKKKLPEPIRVDAAEVAQGIFGNLSRDTLEGIRLRKLQKIWEEVAGPLASKGELLRISGKTLYIAAESAAIRQEFQFLSERFLKLARAGGDKEINELRFDRAQGKGSKRSSVPYVAKKSYEKGPPREAPQGLLEGLDRIRNGHGEP